MTHIMMPTLYIEPERRQEFIDLITAEVEHSLRVEPGILRFDLAVDQSDPNVIHVYANPGSGRKRSSRFPIRFAVD